MGGGGWGEVSSSKPRSTEGEGLGSLPLFSKGSHPVFSEERNKTRRPSHPR